MIGSLRNICDILTMYADLRPMEALLRTTTLDWTIVRPAGLFDADRVSTTT